MTRLRWLLFLALVSACGAPAGSPATTALPQAPSPSAVRPQPSSAAPSLRFARTAPAQNSEGSAMTDVVAGGPGLVAVGLDGDRNALVWVSADGASWRAVAESAAFAGGVMAGVVSLGQRLLALGSDTTDADDPRAAVWVSADGLSWQRLARTPELDGAQVLDAAIGGRGIAATIVAAGGIPGADRAAVWTSVDGLTWRRGPQILTFEHAFLWTVHTAGTGFIAGGWRRDPAPSAAIWTSPDGETWTLRMLPDGAGLQVRAFANAGTTLVAAGDTVEAGAAAAWTSPDGGATWARADPGAVFADASISSLAPLDGGLLAFGGTRLDAAVWWSPDGRTWERLADSDLEGAYLTSGTVSRGRVVAVGATQERIGATGSFTQRAAAWSSPER